MSNGHKSKGKAKSGPKEKLAPNWMTPQMMDWLSEKLNTDGNVEALISETETMMAQAKEAEFNRMVDKEGLDTNVWKAANNLEQKEALEGIFGNIKILKGLSDPTLKKEFCERFTIAPKKVETFVIRLTQRENGYRGDYGWVTKNLKRAYSDAVLRDAEAALARKVGPPSPQKAPQEPAFRQFAAAPTGSAKAEAPKVRVPTRVAAPAKKAAAQKPKKEKMGAEEANAFVENWIGRQKNLKPLAARLSRDFSLEKPVSRAKGTLDKRRKKNKFEKRLSDEVLFAQYQLSESILRTAEELGWRLEVGIPDFKKEFADRPELIKAYEQKVERLHSVATRYEKRRDRTLKKIDSSSRLSEQYDAWAYKNSREDMPLSKELASKMLEEAQGRKRKLTLEEFKVEVNKYKEELREKNERELRQKAQDLSRAYAGGEEAEVAMAEALTDLEREVDTDTEVLIASYEEEKAAAPKTRVTRATLPTEGRGKGSSAPSGREAAAKPAKEPIRAKSAGMFSGVFSAIGSWLFGKREEGED